MVGVQYPRSLILAATSFVNKSKEKHGRCRPSAGAVGPAGPGHWVYDGLQDLGPRGCHVVMGFSD